MGMTERVTALTRVQGDRDDALVSVSLRDLPRNDRVPLHPPVSHLLQEKTFLLERGHSERRG